MTSPRSFREAFTEDPADVEAKHYRVDWQKCDSDGVPNPENPLPPFCGHCTDEEYVGAIEYGDTIDREADVVWWPCDTLTLARQRDSARDWAAALENRIEKALALHKPGPMLDHYEYGCVCGYTDHRWSECDGCGYTLDDEGELDREIHGRVCPSVAALSGEDA